MLKYLGGMLCCYGAVLSAAEIAREAVPAPTATPLIVAQIGSGHFQTRYKQAFDAMIADLSNPERSFEFVQAASQVGDFRGAIAALERILLINPKLANIRLELGVLYLRVGSFEQAKRYLNQALEAPDIPSEVQVRAARLLAEAETATQRHHFHGQLSAGLHFDTNANAAPDTVNLFNSLNNQVVTTTLDDQNTGREDFSIQVSVNLQHRYSFESQSGHQLETNLLLYGARYEKSPEVTTSLATIDTGPRFYFVDQGFSVRPFVSVSYMELNDTEFQTGFGGGLNLTNRFSAKLSGNLTVEYEDFRYKKSAERQIISNRSGPQISWRSGLNYKVAQNTFINGAINMLSVDANESFESYERAGFSLSAQQYYSAPFNLTQAPWSTSIGTRIYWAWYDAAERAIDPNTKRADTHQDYTLSTFIPFKYGLAATIAVQYTDNQSRLPNNAYDNLSANIGFSWQF